MIGFYNYTVILTYMAVMSAVLGITQIMEGNLPMAIILLMISGGCDMFDGKVARSKKDRTDREKIFGMLETTWHISHTRNFLNTYLCSAYASWSPEVSQVEYYNECIFVVFSYHIRQIIWDMKISEYEKTGTAQYQVDPGHHPHVAD